MELKIKTMEYLQNKWSNMTPVAGIERLEPLLYARDEWKLERQFTLTKWARAFAM